MQNPFLYYTDLFSIVVRFFLQNVLCPDVIRVRLGNALRLQVQFFMFGITQIALSYCAHSWSLLHEVKAEKVQLLIL